jgi:hypothetical protein
VIEARLRNPTLSFEEVAELHQQALAFHQLLSALPPPRPPKLGD